MRTVVWSNQALLELAGAIDYLAQRNLVAAQRVEARIIEATEKLALRPIGRPGKRPGLYEKRITGTRYLVIYRLTGATVRIMRLFHTAQDRG